MSLTAKQRARLRVACNLWEGTPYLPGQCIHGPEGGVDCVRLVDAILQDTFELHLDPLPRKAQDAALHSKDAVQEMARVFFERFDLFTVMNPTKFLPTDLVIVRQITRNPTPENPAEHHVFVVGPQSPLLYDAWPQIGVRRIGLGSVKASFRILKIYRSRLAYKEESNDRHSE